MAKLTSKLESFIEMMRGGDEFARHGFDLLTKRPEPEQYFDILDDAGFFDPKNNSGPVPSTEPGFVQIPFWPVLNFLEALARRAGERDDEVLTEKLLKVIRNVSNYRDPDGTARDNYHTYYKFADIFGLLPLTKLTKSDLKLARVWLASRFDNGLVGTSLGKLLRRLLVSGGTQDIEKACLLMKECVAFRWLPEEDKRGRELLTVIDDYWLKQIIDSNAKELGAKAGLPAVKIFEDGLRAIFGDPRRGYSSTLWRPAIETNQQNMDFRRAENRFVEGMRDSLLGWLEANPTKAIPYVRKALTAKAEIVRRIAIHTATENFAVLRESVEAVIGPRLFSSGHRHELYRLLRERFAALSPSGKKAVISAVRRLPEPKTGEEPRRRLKYTQREWLTAIKDQPEAADWYMELSADPELGSPTEHPDFLSYHEMRYGPGPTPFGEDSLIAFAEDGSLVGRLNEFTEKDSWRGPTLGGLVAALEAAVAASPNTFLPILSDFHRAKLPFQHALLRGFKRDFDSSNERKSELNWHIAWPKLVMFFSETLDNPTFWTEMTPTKNADLIPNRRWMTTLIADFLEAGTKRDETAYSIELLPEGWRLITILLERAADEGASLTDPMTHALNTEKGRVIAAMYNHALRVCRVAKQQNRSIAEAWASVRSAFDAELAKSRDANFEFSTLSASYIANLDYMSHDWLVANVKGLFPSEFPVNFKAALGGLAYATPTRPIYQLLRANGVFDSAIKAKVEDSHSKERITEWICLAYLWGDESLNSPIINRLFTAGLEPLLTAAEFFWRVRGDQLNEQQVERVLAFWAKCLEWSKTQKELPTLLLSRLARLASYLEAMDARGKELLLAVVPYVHRDHSTHQMVEELARLVDTDPGATAEVLERMLDANAPNYDMDNRLKGLIEKLWGLGLRAEAIRCVEKLRKSLPGMIEFYRHLVTDAGTIQ